MPPVIGMARQQRLLTLLACPRISSFCGECRGSCLRSIALLRQETTDLKTLGFCFG
jgi:hypothetical protein